MSSRKWSPEKAQARADDLMAAVRETFYEVLPDAPRKNSRSLKRRLAIEMFDKPTFLAGIYVSFPEKVVLNKELLDFHGSKAWTDILAHEIGHATIFRIYGSSVSDHGPEWKALTAAIGGSAETQHEYSVDHIALKNLDRFFLYVNRDESFYDWLTLKQHRNASRRAERDNLAQAACVRKVENKNTTLVYRPDMVKKISPHGGLR